MTTLTCQSDIGRLAETMQQNVINMICLNCYVKTLLFFFILITNATLCSDRTFS